MDRTAEDDRDYFMRRSEQHRAAARRCVDADARDIHERFAAAYARHAASVVDQD